MQRNELEGLVSVYEGGFEEIQSILDDDELTAREKVEAIDDVVSGEDEDDSTNETDE
jgi:hypothetical protein